MLWVPFLAGAYMYFKSSKTTSGSATPTAGTAVYGPRLYGPTRADVDAAAWPKAIALVKLREGSRKNKAGQHITYYDSRGKLTGGYGHLIKSSDAAAYKAVGAIVPQSQADAWFSKDIADAFGKAKQQAAEIGKYTPGMIAALTSANFQLGNFKAEFYGTYPLLVRGDIKGFIKRIYTQPWAAQTPVRVADLVQTVKDEFGVA